MQNRTWEMPPDVAPRNVDVHLKDEDSQLVEITWLPPKTANSRTTGTFKCVCIIIKSCVKIVFSRLRNLVHGKQK